MEKRKLDVNQVLVKERDTIPKKDSKSEDPQRHLIKFYCDVLFYTGFGNVWYEHRNLTKTQKIFYKICFIIVHTYIFGNYINEVLAYLRTDMTEKEKNDLMQLTVAHFALCFKIIMMHIKEKPIKVLLKRFFEEKREFVILEVDVESVRKAKMYCNAMIITTIITLTSAFLDGIRFHFTEGVPIRTELVYYPQPKHSGLVVNILRAFVELHWWYLVTAIMMIDCVCSCCLVFTGFKFRTLNEHFKNIGKKFSEDPEKDLDVMEEKYRKDIEACIDFHKEILWCVQYVQYALGNVYSIHVLESISILVLCLYKLATLELTITMILANFAFISCMIVLNGSYMMCAGDITYEAEQTPTAIFHSGWEHTRYSKKVRNLIIPALIRSQEPVFMTAFGILNMSYNNFIMVLRSSYSFFAVMSTSM